MCYVMIFSSLYKNWNWELNTDVIIYCTVVLLLISQQFVSLQPLLPLTPPDHPDDADDQDEEEGGALHTGDDQTAVPPAQPVVGGPPSSGAQYSAQTLAGDPDPGSEAVQLLGVPASPPAGQLGHQTDPADEVERHPEPVYGRPHRHLLQGGGEGEGQGGQQEEAQADDEAAQAQHWQAGQTPVQEAAGEGSDQRVHTTVYDEQQAGLEQRNVL